MRRSSILFAGRVKAFTPISTLLRVRIKTAAYETPSMARMVFSVTLLALASACGGGNSSPAPAPNPVPSITNLSPASTMAAAAGQTLTVNGLNFMSTSTVTYNGTAHAATFNSATQLLVPLSAADQSTAGNFPVVVTNPSPGGGSSNSVNFTVNLTVNVSPSSASVQAGMSQQFAATVVGSSDTGVAWQVNGIAGGNATVGMISATGLYTAPASVAETMVETVSAVSHADNSKSGSGQSTIFSAPRIAVRQASGAGQFIDQMTGNIFVPRGNNYIRLAALTATWGGTTFHSTFNVGLYDAAKAESALAAMQANGYNIVRVFLDGCCVSGALGDPAGGISSAYVANVVDFLNRAKTHGIFVMTTFDDIPKVGGYQEMIGPSCASTFDGCYNLEYITQGGIDANKKFWADFMSMLLAQAAPMEEIFAFELCNEFHFKVDLPPFSQTTGTVTAANGQTYDMASAVDKQNLMNDSLIYWTDQVRSAIQRIAPNILVDVGFWSPNTPDRPPFSAAAGSTADFVDFHTGPGGGETLALDVSNWGMNGFSPKPVLMGEFAASLANFPSEMQAAQVLRDWQVQSCSFGFQGWLLWNWDTSEQPDFWNALSGNGLINQVLAPVGRPDPCAN